MSTNLRFKLKLETRYMLFLVSVFTVLLVIFAVSSRFILQSLEENIYTLNAENLETTAYIIDSHIESIELYGDSFLSNNVYKESLAVLAESDDQVEISVARMQISQQLNYGLGESPYITGATFTFPDGYLLYSGDGYDLDRAFSAEQEEKALESGGRPVWATDRSGALYYVRDLRRVKNSKLEHLAYLYLKVDLAKMIADLNKDFLIAVYDHDNELFSNLTLPEGMHEELLSELKEKAYTTTGLGKKDYLVSHDELNGGSWHCLSFFDTTSIQSDISRSFTVAVAGTAVLLLLTLLVIRRASNSLLSHIHVLKDKMAAFSDGTLELSEFPDYEGREDEIGKLHQDFDKMTMRFDELIKDNYVNKIIVKDSQIQLLSQQVNPYFLSNVLDSIYWSAQCYGAEDIAKMSYSLAWLFRLTSSNPSIIVSASEELEYLDHYLSIQKTRFPDRLFVVKEIDESLLATQVPRLSIQPLVANALTHSMKKHDRPCTVTVSLSRDADNVVLSVRNTGSAFPDWEDDEKGTLKSIKERLALIYGEKARLVTMNEEDAAVAVISVPFEGEIHVQSLDSP